MPDPPAGGVRYEYSPKQHSHWLWYRLHASEPVAQDKDRCGDNSRISTFRSEHLFPRLRYTYHESINFRGSRRGRLEGAHASGPLHASCKRSLTDRLVVKDFLDGFGVRTLHFVKSSLFSSF